jgi:superfamily II DNA or RNA helicase
MKLDENRLARQKEAVEKWIDNGCIGIGVMATGFGKSLVAILAIQRMQQRVTTRNAIIVVPTDYLREQWRKLVDTFKLNYVYVETWQSLINNIDDNECDLLIIDEVHSNTAPESRKVFDIPHRWFMGLTASLPKDEESAEYLISRYPIFDEITLEMAEKNGWVSNFTVYNLGIEMNEEDKRYYSKLNKEYLKYFSTFDYDFTLAMGCMNNDIMIKRVARELQWEEKMVRLHAIQFNRKMQERKKYLYKAQCLIDTVIDIIKLFPDRKIITFGESTETADALQKLSPRKSVTYHSNLETIIVKGKKKGKTILRREAMEQFNNDTVRICHTAKALNVGADVKGVDMAIIYAFNSSTVDSIQRTGRAVRYADGKHAIEVNVYIKNTQSEKWLQNKQKKTPNIKWIDTIDDIV